MRNEYPPEYDTPDASGWDGPRLRDYGDALGITPTPDAIRATYKYDDSGATVGVLLPNGERLHPGSARDMARLRALPEDEPVRAWIVSGGCCDWEFDRLVTDASLMQEALDDFANGLAEHYMAGPDFHEGD